MTVKRDEEKKKGLVILGNLSERQSGSTPSQRTRNRAQTPSSQSKAGFFLSSLEPSVLVELRDREFRVVS